MDFHFFREKIQEGIISTMHIIGIRQPIDILTKAVNRETLERFQIKLKLCESHNSI